MYSLQDAGCISPAFGVLGGAGAQACSKTCQAHPETAISRYCWVGSRFEALAVQDPREVAFCLHSPLTDEKLAPAESWKAVNCCVVTTMAAMSTRLLYALSCEDEISSACACGERMS